jgi:hypothetical protein
LNGFLDARSRPWQDNIPDFSFVISSASLVQRDSSLLHTAMRKLVVCLPVFFFSVAICLERSLTQAVQIRWLEQPKAVTCHGIL